MQDPALYPVECCLTAEKLLMGTSSAIQTNGPATVTVEYVSHLISSDALLHSNQKLHLKAT